MYVRYVRRSLAAAGGRFHGYIICTVPADQVDLVTLFC